MADTSLSEQPSQATEPQTNGLPDGVEDDEKSKMRPADIDADMREMERRKRVEMIMNSRLFREELERIIECQLKDGNGPAGLLQQISDMMGMQGGRLQSGNVFKSASCVVPINDIRGVESMGYAKGEKILRCKLAAVYRLMDLYGWSQGVYNQITARLNQDQEHFLVNPFGMLYHEITASSLVKIDMQGNIVESGTTNFGVNVTGFMLHAAIHAARPDIKCIIHVHTPSVLAVSSLKCGLLPLCQEAVVVGEISQHPYLGCLSEPEEREKIARNLGPLNKVMFLTNHGVVCCGETVEEAFFNVYNTVLACETQIKLMPMGVDNLVLVSDEARKQIYEAARRPPDSAIKQPDPADLPPSGIKKEKQWRVGGVEFEALMRMLDNAGFRTGYIYRHPLVKGDPPRPRNDVEVPPAVSSLGYLLEEEEMYKQGHWKKYVDGRKTHDRTRWLNSPNVYQKVEILETGTPDPKKITKWVDANAEEWVAEGSPTHSSTPVKIESALQFVPKGTDPKEFKKLQQQIKDNRRSDKITSGPQSHILEGVSWEEAKKLQDANISATGDQVILVGAASKGIIQRGFQHNALVYKTPYAKNPFDTITDEELEEYKKVVERKARGESFDEDQSESEPLSSSLHNSRPTNEESVSAAKSPLMSPTSAASETEEESRDEPRVLRIETKQVPRPSQAEVVLSDDDCGKLTQEISSCVKNRRIHQERSVSSFSQLFNSCSGNIFVNAKLSSSYLSPIGNFPTTNSVVKSSLHTITSSLVPYVGRHWQSKRRLGNSIGCHITRFSNIPHLQRKEASEAMWASRIERFNSSEVNTLSNEKLRACNKNLALNNKVFDPLKRSQYFREESVLKNVQNEEDQERNSLIEKVVEDDEVARRSEGETFVSQIIGFHEVSDRYENLSRGENVQACQYNGQNTEDVSELRDSNLGSEVFQCGTNYNEVNFSFENKNYVNENLKDNILNINSANTNKNTCGRGVVLPIEIKNKENNGKTKSLFQKTKLSLVHPFNVLKLEDLFDHNFKTFPSKWCFAEEPLSVIQNNVVVNILSKDKIYPSVLENIAFDGRSLCIRHLNDQSNVIRGNKHLGCQVFPDFLHVKVHNFLRYSDTADVLPSFITKEYIFKISNHNMFEYVLNDIFCSSWEGGKRQLTCPGNGESICNQTVMKYLLGKTSTEGSVYSKGTSTNYFTMRNIFCDPETERSCVLFSKLTDENNAALLTSVIKCRDTNNAESIGITDQPSLKIILECSITVENVPSRVSPHKKELCTSPNVKNGFNFLTFAQKTSELVAALDVEREDHQLNEYRHSSDPNINVTDLLLNPDVETLLENCVSTVSDLSVDNNGHQITKQETLVCKAKSLQTHPMVKRIKSKEYFYYCQKYVCEKRKICFPLHLLPSLRLINSSETVNNKVLTNSVKKKKRKFPVSNLMLDKYSVIVEDEAKKYKFSNFKSCKTMLNDVEQFSKDSSTSRSKLCPVNIDLQSFVLNHRFNNLLLLKVRSLLEKNCNKYIQNNGSQSQEIHSLLSCRNRIGFTLFSCILNKPIQQIVCPFSRINALDTHVKILLDKSHTVRHVCENFTARNECLSLDIENSSTNGMHKNTVSVYKSSSFDTSPREYHKIPNGLDNTMIVLNFKEIFKDLRYDLSMQLSYDEINSVMHFLTNFSNSEKSHFSARTGHNGVFSSNLFPCLHQFLSQNGSKSLSNKKEKEMHSYNRIAKEIQHSLLFLLCGYYANPNNQITGHKPGIHRNGNVISECLCENPLTPNLRDERLGTYTKMRKDDFCTLLGNYGASLSCIVKEQERKLCIPVTRGKDISVSDPHFHDDLQVMRLFFTSNLCTELILRFECYNTFEEPHSDSDGCLPQLSCETDKKSYISITEHDEEPASKSSEITESKSTMVATLLDLSPLNSLSSNCSCNSLCSCNFSDTINSDLSMSTSSLDIVTALTEAPSITPDQSVDYYSFSSPVLDMEDPYLSLSDIPESQNYTFSESQSLNLSDLSCATQELEASEDDLDPPPSHNSQKSETGLNPYLKICFSSSESVASMHSNSNGICSSCGCTSQVSLDSSESGQPTSTSSYNSTLSRTSSPYDSQPSAPMEIFVCAECKFNLQNLRNVHNGERTNFIEGKAESVHLSANVHFDSDLMWEENLSPITLGNVSMHISGQYKVSLSFAQAEDVSIQNVSSNKENYSVNVSLDCSTEREEECNFVSVEKGVVGYKSKRKKRKSGGKIEKENVKLEKSVVLKENNILKENVNTAQGTKTLAHNKCVSILDEEHIYPSFLSGQLAGKSQSCVDLSSCENSINKICRGEILFNEKESSSTFNHALEKERKEVATPIVKSISLGNLCVNEANHTPPVQRRPIRPIQRRRTYDTFFIDGEHIFAVLTPERDFSSKSATNNLQVPQILSDNSDVELLASSPSYESDERNFAEYINSLNYSPISLPSGNGTDISSLSSLPSDRLPLSDIDSPVLQEHN